MDKKEVAAVLEEIALLLDLAGENPFKVRAYEAGARAVLTFPGDLAAALGSGELAHVKGIGKSLARVIEELLTQGEASLHRELKDKTPPGLLELLRVPGLGPKKARVLFDELHITSLGELEYACRENRLVALPGFGAKSQEKIKAGLANLSRYAGLFRLGDLLPLAESLTDRWRGVPGLLRLEVAGPVRRRLEVADAIDLTAATDHPHQVLAGLTKILGAELVERGPGQAGTTLPQGVPLRLTLAAPEAFGAAWLAATGNDDHVAALQGLAREHHLELTPQGLWAAGILQPCREEADIYRRLGLPLMPPELREGLGEIEAGRQNLLAPAHYPRGRQGLLPRPLLLQRRGQFPGGADRRRQTKGLELPGALGPQPVGLLRRGAESAGPHTATRGGGNPAAGTSGFYPVLGSGIGHPKRRLPGLPR